MLEYINWGIKKYIDMITYFFSGKILVVYIVICIICSIFYLRKTKSEFRNLEVLFIVVFFVYLYFVIKITQFPIFQTENMKEVLGGNIYASINMIPFKSIFNLTSLYNIILTMPVGLLVPVLKRKKMTMQSILFMIILPGLIIEGGQFVQLLVIGYTLRVIDINDIICNSIGVLAGYTVFWALQKITARISDIKIIEFLNKV